MRASSSIFLSIFTQKFAVFLSVSAQEVVSTVGADAVFFGGFGHKIGGNKVAEFGFGIYVKNLWFYVVEHLKEVPSGDGDVDFSFWLCTWICVVEEVVLLAMSRSLIRLSMKATASSIYIP